MSSSSSSTTWSKISVWAASTEAKSGVSSAGSKKQSAMAFPCCAGRFSGRHCRPNVFRISLNMPSRFTFSASILLIMISRQSLRCALKSIMRWVTSSTPVWALTTIAAVSTAGSTLKARPMKSGYPGVSSRLMKVPSISRWHMLASRECWRRFSWSV